MFRAHVLIIRGSKLHYTASGIITLIGSRLVHETATYFKKHPNCLFNFFFICINNFKIVDCKKSHLLF